VNSGCPIPWSSLMLLPNSIGPECRLGTQFKDPTPNISLIELWNSNEFKELRVRHFRNDPPETCQDCATRNIGLEHYRQFDSIMMTEDVHKNFQANQAEYLAGEIHLKSLPITVSSDLLYSCNFSCSLCTLKYSREKVADSHIQEIFNEISPKLVTMHFSGGEPLLDKRFTKFLSRAPHPDIALSITTNGSLINSDILNDLSRFAYVNLHISIDSFNSDVFQELRPGPLGLEAILERVSWAIEYRDRINTKMNDQRWYIALQIVPVSKNIPELAEYIRNAAELGVNEISICPVSGDHPDDDYLEYPELLPDLDRAQTIEDIIASTKKYPALDTTSIIDYLSELSESI